MWITCVPLAWLVAVTFTAGVAEDLLPDSGGGLSGAGRQLEAGAAGRALDATTRTLIFNARLDAAVCGLFLVLVAAILVDSVRVWIGILRGTREAPLCEAPFVLSRLRGGGAMRRCGASARLLLAILRELADESAYRRHLAAHGRAHSGEEWRRFSRPPPAAGVPRGRGAADGAVRFLRSRPAGSHFNAKMTNRFSLLLVVVAAALPAARAGSQGRVRGRLGGGLSAKSSCAWT